MKDAPKYYNWRSQVEQKIRAKGWLWKKDGRNLYNTFIIESINLADFPVSATTTIKLTPKTDDPKPTHKALNELIMDCFKKVRESKQKRSTAAGQEDIAGEEEGTDGAAD